MGGRRSQYGFSSQRTARPHPAASAHRSPRRTHADHVPYMQRAHGSMGMEESHVPYTDSSRKHPVGAIPI
eukprot:3285390-Prymnesium_polylepis.1